MTMNQLFASPTVTVEDQAGYGRVAFIQSCWHRDIVDQCKTAFLANMERGGLSADRIDLFEVPGAFEIPLMAKRLAGSGRYAAIVASGFVVDGGIYRHEFVASAVIDGLMRVQLDTGVPVLSAVLTPHHFQESEAHIAFFREHFLIKGAEAASACLQTIENLRRVDPAEAAPAS
jgi:6,7-dimethyl-8-ribityllumazine synthase